MAQATIAASTRHAPTVPMGRLAMAELRWIFRRPRTLIVLGLLALIPVIVGISLTLVNDSQADGGGDPVAGLLGAAVGNAFVLPIAVLAVTIMLLLPLVTAMASADALAGESAHGTLRSWLLAPVGRGKLLAIKAFGVGTVTLVATMTIAVVGVITGLALNGSGALVTISGTTLDMWSALGKILLAVAWVTLQLWAVAAIALAISACTEHPMLVVVSILAGTIVFSVLGSLSAVDWLHPFLLNESWSSIGDFLRDPMPTGTLIESTFRAASYIVIGLSLAYARVTTRDG